MVFTDSPHNELKTMKDFSPLANPSLILTALLFFPAAAEPRDVPLLPEETVAALAAELSGTHARHVVQELSLHHRMRGSEGFARAAEAIRARAESHGLELVELIELPADGNRFYGTQRSRPAWDVRFAELWEVREVDGQWRDARLVADVRTRPVTLAQDSASGEVTAELVDVGAGTSSADYEGKDVRDKLVLTSSQPSAVRALAVGEHGAAGIVSYAQNQKSAWWGEDRNLVRWGHLDAFPRPTTFAFMVTVKEAMAWRDRLAAGIPVVLRAKVEAGQHPGAYTIATAVIPGADPDLRAQEIVYSCHLDHQRPGANDNASGCAAILEAARALAKLVDDGKIPPPRRTMRFLWPPEIEGTIALLNARPDLARRARAVIHMDMVGGHPELTKAIFHVTRSPASLPSVVSDVAEAFGDFANRQSYAYSATGQADYPLVDPEGSRQALQARFADFSMGSDHQVWAEGSFRVPAIYLNDWPDRYIHTHADSVANIDPTKLLRAAFIGAASGYYLARLGDEDVPDLLRVVRRHGLARTSQDLARSRLLEGAQAVNLLDHRLAFERAVMASVGRFAAWDAESRRTSEQFLEHLEALVRNEAGASDSAEKERDDRVCRRHPEPKGPLWGFGYSYFEDQMAKQGLARPELLSFQGLWGSGSEYAYEVLNLVDGRRGVSAIRDAVSATYGPVPTEHVSGYLTTLEDIGLLACDGGATPWQTLSTQLLAARAGAFAPPEDSAELGAAGYAKVLCSAVFVSGRDPEEAKKNSAYLFLSEAARERLSDVRVDRDEEEVRVTLDGRLTRTARFYGSQGCVIHPRGRDGVFFEPVPVVSTLPDASTQPWPLGDVLADEPLPPEIDGEKLAAAVNAAFADPEALTAAFVVVYKGRIIAERYGPGIGQDTQLESWSMGKSLTATLAGVLVQEGALDLHGPAPILAWQQPGDPRSQIRVIDLLRMSSGLGFIAPRDPDFAPEKGYPDHMYIYTGAVDAFEFSISRPQQFPPNTEGRYRNSDPLTLGYLVREAVRERGEEYLTFPQRSLFDRIGIRRQVLETDPYGNFLLTGYDYGTGRNWARLGLLYLNDGGFAGERILPEDWAELVSTPAPAWTSPVYGGLFWLNRTGALNLPHDAYYMAGAGGQRTIIVPSREMVIVRLGHQRGSRRGSELLNEALGLLMEAVSEPSSGARLGE